MKIDVDCAIITIKDGIVYLDYSWNPDAGCCEEDENLVQLEEYDHDGWNEPKTNPRLVDEFWTVWSDWNGRMSGGIWLYDDHTYEEAGKMIGEYPHICTKDIASAEDGTYVVEWR